MKSRIRRNDIVKVVSGDDCGKTGKVLRILKDDGKAIVEGVNFVWKHLRKSQQHPKGARIQKEAPIGLSNLMVICQLCNKATKIALGKVEGKSVRICKKCREALPVGTSA
ncbi:MAG: 50S ribosomal protein L24 [Planctomycetes bacterium RBG_16_59_8]|nr:MAG: 50S ribosomal protein L24 [Planctomycetes bacterium RBG_16_59_8]